MLPRVRDSHVAAERNRDTWEVPSGVPENQLSVVNVGEQADDRFPLWDDRSRFPLWPPTSLRSDAYPR